MEVVVGYFIARPGASNKVAKTIRRHNARQQTTGSNAETTLLIIMVLMIGGISVVQIDSFQPYLRWMMIAYFAILLFILYRSAGEAGRDSRRVKQYVQQGHALEVPQYIRDAYAAALGEGAATADGLNAHYAELATQIIPAYARLERAQAQNDADSEAHLSRYIMQECARIARGEVDEREVRAAETMESLQTQFPLDSPPELPPTQTDDPPLTDNR